MKEKRVCLNCGDELRGRADQKFCSDSCRNAYNNEQNNASNNLMRKINRTLRRNRKILQEICPHEKTRSNKSLLTAEGFNFNYHTNSFKTKKGQEYVFCYDYGYLELDNDELIIVKRKDYVD